MLMTAILTTLTLYQTALPAAEGFRKAEPGYQYSFPEDHGSHPEYAIEWWYITGHLFESNGRRFGFQATFFRRGIEPRATTGALFGRRQIFMAHMAILDADTGQFLSQDRINRDGWDASSKVGSLAAHNGNWSLIMTDDTREVMQLKGTVLGQYAFDLTLEPAKPLVIFGENGVSVKGEGSASLYITFPRLKVTGALTRPDQTVDVTGTAWMDHEISTSQLTEEQVGWDWASIQLDDGSEIMMYLLRQKDGSWSSSSKLTWISPESEPYYLDSTAFTWKSRASWTSKRTDITYPVDFDLGFVHPRTGEQMNLRLMPIQYEQEFVGNVTDIHYWEGACNVLNKTGATIGKAFIELTGYGESIQGKF